MAQIASVISRAMKAVEPYTYAGVRRKSYRGKIDFDVLEELRVEVAEMAERMGFGQGCRFNVQLVLAGASPLRHRQKAQQSSAFGLTSDLFRGDSGNPFSRHILEPSRIVQDGIGQDHQFGCGVPAVEIPAWIGFEVSALLRALQGFFPTGALGELIKDVSSDDVGDRLNALDRRTPQVARPQVQGGQSPCHRAVKPKLGAVCSS